jgi:hypothetical protein
MMRALVLEAASSQAESINFSERHLAKSGTISVGGRHAGSPPRRSRAPGQPDCQDSEQLQIVADRRVPSRQQAEGRPTG